ncbi:MAG: SIMPL domain-containing protein [Rhodococcus sp. (in: high G+C Gram-positive bacteria)]|uniref:SIMPL domain-containing protein n=1 Tax=Rhodococcus sp. TaxID=1831 RepID=UPI003BB49A48
MDDRPVTITVTGHAELEFAPNRCTVVLQSHADGATREQAADPVAAAVDALASLVADLREQPGSPVKQWTFDRVQHSRHRPYSQDGEIRPWQYTSSASLTVTFRAFDAIAAFVDSAAGIESVAVADLRWWLTRRKQHERRTRVRDLAVRDARDKATGYAKSLGYSTLHVVSIADPGILGLHPTPGPAPMMRATAMRADMASGSDGGGREVALEPDRISIAADVEARFEAT